MRETERARFALVVNALAALFHREISEAMLHGFWIGLDDLPIEAVERGAARAMRESRFMPTPAELRELAGDVSDADLALLAWSVFERAVVAVGAYKTADFGDPVLNATVRHLGGWEHCCELPTNEFDIWLRKEFLRVYEAFSRTGVSEEAGAPLIGVFDRTNALLGHDRPATVKVATGLPAQRYPRLSSRQNAVPRLEFKRP